MENKNGSAQLAELVNKHFEKIKIMERISCLVFSIGFAFFLMKKSDFYFVFIIGTLLTAITYFLFAFKVVETENLEGEGILGTIGFINFVYKLTFLSLAMSFVSMIGFVIQFDNPMHLIGGITLIITLILSLITKLNDRTIIYNSTFYLRIVICLVLLGYLLMIK